MKKIIKYNRKLLLVLLLLIILLVVSIFSLYKITLNSNTMNVPKYDLDTPISDYHFKTKYDAHDYYEFLISNIKPKELQQYDGWHVYWDIRFNDPTFTVKGEKLLPAMTCYAYREYIESYLFSEDHIIDEKDPVSKKFLKKYGKSVRDYYGIKHTVEIESGPIEYSFSGKDQTFVVDDFVEEEREDHPGEYIPFYYNVIKFKYILDENGYIDDLEIVKRII